VKWYDGVVVGGRPKKIVQSCGGEKLQQRHASFRSSRFEERGEKDERAPCMIIDWQRKISNWLLAREKGFDNVRFNTPVDPRCTAFNCRDRNRLGCDS